MEMWVDEKYDLLVQEADRCNSSLRVSKGTFDDDAVARIFSRLMLQGKLKAAVQFATERSKGSVLHPSDIINDSITVMDALRAKHPNPSAPCTSALLNCENLPQFEDVEVTGHHILHIARRIQGSAGPSGCDANYWHSVLLRYGSHSGRLRDALASLVRRISNNIVPWGDIHALMANRLIALDKCPGVCPIGKSIGFATRLDLEVSCGVDQLSAGVKSGIEGAIHAVNDLYMGHHSLPAGWRLLLVDAKNAFNSLNRAAMLWNV